MEPTVSTGLLFENYSVKCYTDRLKKTSIEKIKHA